MQPQPQQQATPATEPNDMDHASRPGLGAFIVLGLVTLGVVSVFHIEEIKAFFS